MSSVERSSNANGRDSAGDKESFEDVHVENHDAKHDSGAQVHLSDSRVPSVPDDGLEPVNAQDARVIVTEEDVSRFKELMSVCDYPTNISLVSRIEQAHSKEDRPCHSGPYLLDLPPSDPRQINH